MNFLGIDVGGTQIKAGIVDGHGRILQRSAVATPTTLPEFLDAFERLVRGVTASQPVAAAGVACKGIIGPETRIVSIPGVYRFLEGQLLGSLVREAVQQDIPVEADNDARVALVGEMAWGAAKGLRNVVLLTLGTGVGGAALVEGKLLKGHGGAGGHFGHLTVDPAGPWCNCGNRGCLETFFSAVAIEAEALAAIRRSSESRLTDEFREHADRLTSADVFRLAEAGDATALHIRDRAVQYLAAGVAGLVHAFDPEVVILSGRMADAGACVFDVVNHHVRESTRRIVGRETAVVASQLSDPSGIAGAAALAQIRLRDPDALR